MKYIFLSVFTLMSICRVYGQDVRTDTVRFITYDDDYDYQQIIWEQSGDLYGMVTIEYRELYRGDIIIITMSDEELEIAGDGSIMKMKVVSEIELLEKGALSLFYEKNRDNIRYTFDKPENDNREYIPALDYLLANIGGMSGRDLIYDPDVKVEVYLHEPAGEVTVEGEDPFENDMSVLQVDIAYITDDGEIFHDYVLMEPGFPVNYYLYCADRSAFVKAGIKK